MERAYHPKRLLLSLPGAKRPRYADAIAAPEPVIEPLDLPLMTEAVVAVRPRREPGGGFSLPRNEKAPRALIVGAGAIGTTLAETLESQRGYAVVGFVDDEADGVAISRWPLLGRRDQAVAIAAEYGVSEIILAYAPSWQQEFAESLAAELDGVRIRVVPSFYESLMRTKKVENVGDIALVPLSTQVAPGVDFAKRVFDLTVAVVMLLLVSPILPLVALLIKLSSRGPAIFAQVRIGRMGRPFTLYKFRTMRSDAEALTGPVLSPGSDDTRLTPIGKWLRIFRIDEIPQLWNVLRGEMSLVGPRPERPRFVEKFAARNPIYARRHLVRPGITGLAQIRGGYHTDARDKLRFDLYYISHQSVGFDLAILWQTILLIFRSRDY